MTITSLPTLRILSGNEVAFEGKTELRQAIAGRFAKNLTVVNFQAAGEHAEKSLIKIHPAKGSLPGKFVTSQ